MAIPTELPGRWYERWQRAFVQHSLNALWESQALPPDTSLQLCPKGKMLEKERHCSVQQCVDIASGTLIVYKLVFVVPLKRANLKQALGIEVKITTEQDCGSIIQFSVM